MAGNRLPGSAMLLLCLLGAVLQAHGAVWLYGEPQRWRIVTVQSSKVP